MAKKSMIAREKKRADLIARKYKHRETLRGIARSLTASEEEKDRAQRGLQKLPRDSSASRARRRCGQTGRPHGVYRKFGLGRNKLREAVMRGDVPGVVKASW